MDSAPWSPPWLRRAAPPPPVQPRCVRTIWGPHKCLLNSLHLEAWTVRLRTRRWSRPADGAAIQSLSFCEAQRMGHDHGISGLGAWGLPGAPGPNTVRGRVSPVKRYSSRGSFPGSILASTVILLLKAAAHRTPILDSYSGWSRGFLRGLSFAGVPAATSGQGLVVKVTSTLHHSFTFTESDPCHSLRSCAPWLACPIRRKSRIRSVRLTRTILHRSLWDTLSCASLTSDLPGHHKDIKSRETIKTGGGRSGPTAVNSQLKVPCVPGP